MKLRRKWFKFVARHSSWTIRTYTPEEYNKGVSTGRRVYAPHRKKPAQHWYSYSESERIFDAIKYLEYPK